jgi:hypothetical protein
MANAAINLHLAEIEVDETLLKFITPASQRGTMIIAAVRLMLASFCLAGTQFLSSLLFSFGRS